MIILGISAFVHDSAACLIKDGHLIANVEEERLTRHKHTAAFPLNAIDFVLAKSDVSLSDVDVIAFNWNPFKAFVAELAKLIIAPLIYFKVMRHTKPPKSFRSIFASFRLKRTINTIYKGKFKGRIIWVDHHLAHASSSYFLSPFNMKNADVIVVDGHGENCSTSVYSMINGKFHRQWQAPVWDSLGILYTTFTNFLGFDIYQEGKTMALAAYGKYAFKIVFRQLMDLQPDGRYSLRDKRYLGLWNYSVTGFGKEFGSRRLPYEPMEQRHFDIAFSMQNVIKETIVHIVKHAALNSGNRHLCLSGGVFLNCDINMEILKNGIHESTFVPPFTSDSGGAIGAGLYAAYICCGENIKTSIPFTPYLGPEYSTDEIVSVLERNGIEYHKLEKPWIEAARVLAEERVIGWFQGRMESGPRALGNRSILASPFSHGICEYLNLHVKQRENFRPFAPITTKQAALKYFDICEPLSELTKYMLVTTKVKPEFRDIFPGITHVDGTSRIQIVSLELNPEIYQLLLEFEQLTGHAVLINTSFNLHEPIVCSPEDALNCFVKTPLDVLFIGCCMVSK